MLLYQPHIIHFIIFFISALYVNLLNYTYNCFTFILSNYYFIQGFFSAFFYFSFIWIMSRTIGINNICIKKILFLHSYIITLYMYFRECYFFYNLQFVDFFFILSSLLSFIAIFNNLTKPKGNIFSLNKIFYSIHNCIMSLLFTRKPYFSLVLIFFIIFKNY